MREIFLSKTTRELHLPIVFESEDEARKKLEYAKRELSDINAHIVTLEVFAAKEFDGAVAEFSKDSQYPINVIRPLDEKSRPVLAGVHITAIVGTVPHFAATEKGSKSVEYEAAGVKYCRTFGVLANLPNTDAYAHTYENISELERAIGKFGYTYNDIVRTWFYNDDILSWYDPFNRARTDFYKERKIFDGLLPASTGIGAPNPSGQKITSGAIAVKGEGNWSVREIESPLQCGAPEYGSSFSRAVEIDTDFSRRIMVSGTASIAQNGKTEYVGDIEKQVDLTLRVIDAILKSRGMSLGDTVRAIVYCLKPEYYRFFKIWAEKHGTFQHCPAYSIVCRNNLLFEIELEAAINK